MNAIHGLAPPKQDSRLIIAPIFQYDRLENEKRQIRLVRLRKADSPNDCVWLDLITIDLASHFNYSALSYTWGRPGKNFPASWDDENYLLAVMLKGRKFFVRPNLYYALVQIRKQCNESTWYWIDAIYIDQAHTREKSCQVAVMGKIYARAEYTWIWLGPADEFTERAISKINELSKSWGRRPESMKEDYVHESDVTGNADLFRHDIGSIDAFDDWEAVRSLCSRFWFSRAWVVQEVCLADEGAILIDGSSTLDLETLSHVARMITQISTNRDIMRYWPSERMSMQSLKRDLSSLAALINTVISHNRWKENGIPTPCYFVLQGLREMNSKDPRDKVYAGLGLCEDFEQVIVDYENKTAVQVFTDACIAAIMKQGTFHFLSYCYFPPKIPGLPSWVPDWTDQSRADYVPLPKRNMNSLHVPSEEAIYGAGTNAQDIRPRFDPRDARYLHIYGGVFDEIDFVATSVLSTDSNEQRKMYRSIWAKAAWLREWALDRQARQANYALLEPASWEYHADQGIEQFTSVLYNDGNYDLLEAYYSTLLVDVVFEAPGERERRIKTCQNLEDLPPGNVPSIYLPGRTLAYTKFGYFALVPDTSQAGDNIFVVQGNETPFVIRYCPDDSAFLFVGECYVNGIMDGEAFVICEEEDILKEYTFI